MLRHKSGFPRLVYFQRSTDALETNDPLLDVLVAGLRDEHQINVAN